MQQAAANRSRGIEVLFMPDFHPGQSNFQSSGINGALIWMAWPSKGSIKAPDASENVSFLQGDQSYMSTLAGNMLTKVLHLLSRFPLVLDTLYFQILL